MQAMLRSPKMCDLYYKSEKDRMSKVDFKIANDQAVLHLRQEKFFECNFVDKLVHKVNQTVT